MKRALIIYAAKDNRNFTIRRLTKTKLCTAYIDTNCKWYIGAFMKAKLIGLWIITSYVGPHNCILFGLRRESKIWILILLHQKLWENCDRITPLVLINSETSYILSIIMSFLTIRYGMQNKRQLLRYLGIEQSYQRLRKLLLAYLDQDPGTQYNYHTIPRNVPGTTLLCYVF